MKLFKKYFSNRDIFIGREMTKIHETFYRDSIKNFESSNKLLKGEVTVVLSKKNFNTKKKFDLNHDKLINEISSYLKRYTLKDVVKLISEKNNISKKQVYELCLKVKK